MRQLKITPEAMQLAADRLAGVPLLMGRDGPIDPGVADAWEEAEHRWQPGNEAARFLRACTEACNDILIHAETYVTRSHERRRVLKQMTIPLVTLLDALLTLGRHVDRQGRGAAAEWPKADRDIYLRYMRHLRKQQVTGPVRSVRSKLAAHVDTDNSPAVGNAIQPGAILELLDECLVALLLAMKHRAAFVWIRGLDAPAGDEGIYVQTIFEFPGSVIWRTDSDGNVLDVIKGVWLAVDPARESQDVVLRTIDAYNAMARLHQLREITVRPTEELLAAERVPIASAETSR